MSRVSETASVKAAIANLNSFLKTLERVPVEELSKSAQTIKEQAIAQTPYKTGKLERSVYVRVVNLRRRARLSAGANAINKGYNYAGIQHENESFQHPLKGKAHYISDPFNDEVKQLKKRLRAKVRLKTSK